MLNKKIGMITLSTLGLLTLSPVVATATDYSNALNAESPVDVEITVPGEITIPPIDPEEPNPPLDPINPDQGEGLSLMYVSSLDFGSTEFKLNESQTVIAKPDSGVNDEGTTVHFENMASVMDIRGSRTGGWTLQVTQAAELFEGATITMNPTVSVNNLGVTVPLGSVLLNGSAQNFALSDGMGEAGIISLGMGAVELYVPAGTGVGEYTTTLNWQLVSEPV